MKMTINNEELAINLTALCLLCLGQGTDNCDIVIKNTGISTFSCLEFRQLVEWLRKYQKIQEIVKNTQQLCSYGSAFIDIREVLEDGNND